jgi:hypothetical protein
VLVTDDGSKWTLSKLELNLSLRIGHVLLLNYIQTSRLVSLLHVNYILQIFGDIGGLVGAQLLYYLLAVKQLPILLKVLHPLRHAYRVV